MSVQFSDSKKWPLDCFLDGLGQLFEFENLPVCSFQSLNSETMSSHRKMWMHDVPCDTFHHDKEYTFLGKYTNPHVLVQTTTHQTPAKPN